MKCTIYTRFSPRPDAATSESCEVQAAYCEEYAIKKGWDIAARFDDADVSGKDEYRERLWQAIETLGKGDVLLVYKRDRLARSVYLAECISRAVTKKGAAIAAVSGDIEGDTPEAVMARQVVAAIAEYERKIIGMRTSAALRHYAKMGRRTSSKPPFGWAFDPADPKRLVKVDSEQRTLAKMIEMRRSGMSFNAIKCALKPEESRSGKWHQKSVQHILEREMAG